MTRCASGSGGRISSSPHRSLGNWTFRARLCICWRIWRCRRMMGRSRCHHQHSPRSRPSSEAAAGVGGGVQKSLPSSYPARQSSGTSSDAQESSGSGSNSGSSSEDTFKRVINVKNYPICRRPRLNKKTEMDIITHVAVCASGDWAKIDKIVLGNFVTASQAQRKWYTKVISKVSSEDYRLGAVCFRFFSPFI